ncbi:MAG: DUF433 domain-containing protein [Dehalococcoidia bacterium]|nr:DUF433 domain-containing protein [Dehalococcoidia bacterium]
MLASLRDDRKTLAKEIASVGASSQKGGKLLAHRKFSGAGYCLKRVEHDDDGMPTRFYPFTRGYGREAPKLVVIDPSVAFGRPVIAGSGVRTGVVARRIKGGELISDVADDYLLEPSQIAEAVRYELAV